MQPIELARWAMAGGFAAAIVLGVVAVALAIVQNWRRW